MLSFADVVFTCKLALLESFHKLQLMDCDCVDPSGPDTCLCFNGSVALGTASVLHKAYPNTLVPSFVFCF